ncbi:MAG: hypothetical protein MJ102_05435 [Clostridia bacterium]|nr:hypothetical protein [Clostridia bacterium]
MKKITVKASVLLLSLLMLIPCAVSCGTKPPELEEVKDTFSSLIEASYEVNDIFFGQGLPVYDRNKSNGAGAGTYDEEHNILYWILNDSKFGIIVKYYDYSEKQYHYLQKTEDRTKIPAGVEPYTDAEGLLYFPIDYEEGEMEDIYDEKSPKYYDYVRLDCKYQNVNSIKDLAKNVYSTDYLEGVYGAVFDGFMTDSGVVYARYMSDETGQSEFFLKSNQFKPYFETQTTYDVSTMKIVKPSNGTRVTVEIEAEGVHIDFEKTEKIVGKYTKNLTFVNENGKWRLDSPTY